MKRIRQIYKDNTYKGYLEKTMLTMEANILEVLKGFAVQLTIKSCEEDNRLI
jgi:hypothetical protein